MESKRPTDGLTQQEDDEVVRMLSHFAGGALSHELFNVMARIVPLPIVEVPIFRRSESGVETLLIPRPQEDTIWSNMMHTPGVALRTSDFKVNGGDPLTAAFKRIEVEIGAPLLKPPEFAGMIHRISRRGAEVVQVFVSTISEESSLVPGALWYLVEALSTYEKFIQDQLGHVILARNHYNS